MDEKILKIEETTFSPDNFFNYDGFVITTNQQEIKLGIENSQCCCEDWGYFMTNDDISEFIGAGVLAIDVVDDCLNKDKLPEVYEGGVMFVNIETTKGTLQFTAYNEHNGYYSHDALVISTQINVSESL